jgi:hypothetical protein
MKSRSHWHLHRACTPAAPLQKRAAEDLRQPRPPAAKPMVWCVGFPFAPARCRLTPLLPPSQFPVSAKAAASSALPPRPSSARARIERPPPPTSAATSSAVADILGPPSSSDEDEPLFDNLNARASSALHSELSPRSRAFAHKVSTRHALEWCHRQSRARPTQVTVPEAPAFLSRQATAKKCIADRCARSPQRRAVVASPHAVQAVRGRDAAAAAGRRSAPPLRHPAAARAHVDHGAAVSAAAGQEQAAQREHQERFSGEAQGFAGCCVAAALCPALTSLQRPFSFVAADTERAAGDCLPLSRQIEAFLR